MKQFEDIIKKHSEGVIDEDIKKVNYQLEEDRIDNAEHSRKITESINCILINIEPEKIEENIEELCDSIWHTCNLKEKLYILDKAGYTLSI